MVGDYSKPVAAERTELYMLIVQYHIYVEKLNIDQAHAKADAIMKYIDQNVED